jgi:hypothetical protein
LIELFLVHRDLLFSSAPARSTGELPTYLERGNTFGGFNAGAPAATLFVTDLVARQEDERRTTNTVEPDGCAGIHPAVQLCHCWA